MRSNRLRDFDPAKFSILALCHTCRHQRVLDLSRLDPDLSIPDLRARLSCSACGSRDTSIRILWIAAGGYTHS
jgi:hypothetical protein